MRCAENGSQSVGPTEAKVEISVVYPALGVDATVVVREEALEGA